MTYNPSEAAIDAAEILVDDGVPVEKAATLVAGYLRNRQDPVEGARHYVKLRAALR